MAEADNNDKIEEVVETGEQVPAPEIPLVDQAPEVAPVVTSEIPPATPPETMSAPSSPEVPPVIIPEPIPVVTPTVIPPEIEEEAPPIVPDSENSFTTASSVDVSNSVEPIDFSNYKPPVGFMAWLLAKARAAKQARKEKKLQKIMLLFDKKEKVTNDAVEKLLHVSDKTASNYLNDLIKVGRIRRLGQGSQIYYEKI